VRLDPIFRGALYAAFAVLVLTGAVWLLADWRKDPLDPDFWQAIAASSLMLHGGAAMVTLMLLGALVPLHVRRAWRSGRNRMTGPAMVAVNAALIATAFGLYYAGSETLRPWISDLHIVVGVALPALLGVHVWLGRRTRPLASLTSPAVYRESRSAAARPPAVAQAVPDRVDTAG
jgi:hypothetical protein